MNLAVTGATGFVGRHFLVSALQRGHHVRALVRPGQGVPTTWLAGGVRVVRGNLGDGDEVVAELLRGADALVHLAAAGVQGRERDWHTAVPVNAVLPLAWLQRAVAHGVSRSVVLGTCLEYAGYGVLPRNRVRSRNTSLCR
ncbi:MAG TPA: NAD(P)-dependent oxidoreductase, partial [Myxococcota bacterium]|nr:NAD(P)-dependent oxidoreductase [Myxococcota bacterium]